MAVELLLIAPEGASCRRAEIDGALAGLSPAGLPRGVALSIEPGAPDEPIEALALELSLPLSEDQARDAIDFAERLATRLGGWRVLESVAGEEIGAVGRERWAREIAAEQPPKEMPASPGERAIGAFDGALSAIFRLPLWLAASLAVAAFAVAAAALLALDVPHPRFGSSLAILGTVLLFLFLLAGGAICAKVRALPGAPPGRSE